MKKSIRKQVIAFTTGLSILVTTPLNTFAEEVNKNKTDQLTIAEGEHLNQGASLADIELKTPENATINEAEVSDNEKILLEEYKHKHDRTAELDKMKEAKTGAVSEAETLQNIEKAFEDVDGKGDGSSREMHQKARTTYSATTKRYGTLAGTSFVEWIVPKGNTDIRPANPMKAKYITIHETANTARGANAESHAKYLYNQATNGTFRTASWHFTVDDKQIYQHLPTNENGWHAGDGNGPGNRASIGIEIAVNQDGDYNKALENAKKLVGYLMNKEGISASNIRKHQDWSGKKCPDIMISRGNFAGFVQGIQWYASIGANLSSLNEVQGNVNPNDYTPGEPSMELVVNGLNVNVRSGAGLDYSVVRKVSKGAKFKVQAVKEGWYKVGKNEWIFYNPSYIKINFNVPQPEKPKDDITGGWFESHIRELNRRGIMVGEGHGVFAPYRATTRAEFAQLISKTLILPKGNILFKDLNSSHPTLREGIMSAASAGIIEGRGNGIFDPNATITREEAAIMTDKALQYKGIKGDLVPLPFTDKHLISYKEPIQRLYGLKVVSGIGNNKFQPYGKTTRGEASAFLVKMLNMMDGKK